MKIEASSIGIIGGADGPTSILISKKMPLKFRIQSFIYKIKRKKMAKKIIPLTHTLDELIDYAKKVYHAENLQIESDENIYASRIFEIKSGDGCLTIEIDDINKNFGVSFSGSKKEKKRFHKIMKDLYIYYGVSQEDIEKKTLRYVCLLNVLSR